MLRASTAAATAASVASPAAAAPSAVLTHSSISPVISFSIARFTTSAGKDQNRPSFRRHLERCATPTTKIPSRPLPEILAISPRRCRRTVLPEPQQPRRPDSATLLLCRALRWIHAGLSVLQRRHSRRRRHPALSSINEHRRQIMQRQIVNSTSR